MANITVTSTTNSIIVDFGVHAENAEAKIQGWPKMQIQTFRLKDDESHICACMLHEKDWHVSHDGRIGTLQIDSVNGITPTSMVDLCMKLLALIA